MMKSLRTMSCLAVLGATLAIAVPAHAETTPTPPQGGAMMMNKDHRGPPPEMMEQGRAMHEKMQSVLKALADDHAQLKAGAPSPALLSKLDQDLTALEANTAEMKAMHEKMKAMHPMGGKDKWEHKSEETQPAPTAEPLNENTRGNAPNTHMKP